MADSKYTISENGYNSSAVAAGVQRSRYSNPNASLPPNSTMPTLRNHMLHKSQPMPNTPHMSLIGTGQHVSGILLLK